METIDCEVPVGMKFRHLLLFVMCLLCLGAIADVNYGVSGNSVVATPIGYEKEATLSTGETVKFYSDALSVDDVTNCHAVMFSILYPPRHRERQLILRHSGCSCYMCALPTPMTNLYQIGKCYLFESPLTVSNALLSSYAIRQPAPALKMERDWGTELYCRVKDVDELGFVMWHLAVFTGALLLCYFSPFLGLLSIPCVISWNYFVLFDKKYRMFKDDYRSKRYEFIGTIWASIVISAVIVGLKISWS